MIQRLIQFVRHVVRMFITAIAFWHPELPSYSLDEPWIQTFTGGSIPCAVFTPDCKNEIDPKRKVILFFHGNCTNLLCMKMAYEILAQKTGCTVVGMEYQTYSPFHHRTDTSIDIREFPWVFSVNRADRIAVDARDVLTELEKIVGVRNVILWGQSVGSGIAVDAAVTTPGPDGQEIPQRRVVLMSPYLSLMSVASESLARWFPSFDVFPTHLSISEVRDVVYCHGTDDPVIPVSHSHKLNEIKPGVLDIQVGAHHNNLEEDSLLAAIREYDENYFIFEE